MPPDLVADTLPFPFAVEELPPHPTDTTDMAESVVELVVLAEEMIGRYSYAPPSRRHHDEAHLMAGYVRFTP